MLSKSPLKLLRSFVPKGGRTLLMSPPCLESQGCHLIPVFLPAPLLFCLVLLLILSSPCLFFQLLFLLKIGYFFCIALVFRCFFLRLGDDKLVCGKCSVLPYGTGISYLCIQTCIFLNFLMICLLMIFDFLVNCY